MVETEHGLLQWNPHVPSRQAAEMPLNNKWSHGEVGSQYYSCLPPSTAESSTCSESDELLHQFPRQQRLGYTVLVYLIYLSNLANTCK